MASESLATALQNLSNTKDDMVAALIEKGVTIDDSAGFSDIASAISTLGPVKLTPVSSSITQSDMYVINIGDQTIVFGSFTASSSGSAVFSFPETFSFAHTSTHTYWYYIANASSTSGYRSTSSYSYSVSTANKQVTLYCYSSGTKYYYTYWFY
jgi:hypothetical protein